MTYRQPFTGDYPITQRYGETYTSAFHTGIDYACPLNTRILASESGQVMFSGWDPTGFGNMVILQHRDGKATLYAHLSSFAFGMKTGINVARGEVIGFSGTTGNSTGPHLHFEARHVWNNCTSHFDPFTLPLMSVDDAIVTQKPQPKPALKGADQLGDKVQVVAPAGAWAWSKDFTKRQTVYLCGQKLNFTGETTRRNGYTYCEVYPDPVTYWVAVHDNDCQILDNQSP